MIGCIISHKASTAKPHATGSGRNSKGMSNRKLFGGNELVCRNTTQVVEYVEVTEGHNGYIMIINQVLSAQKVLKRKQINVGCKS